MNSFLKVLATCKTRFLDKIRSHTDKLKRLTKIYPVIFKNIYEDLWYLLCSESDDSSNRDGACSDLRHCPGCLLPLQVTDQLIDLVV